MIQRPGGWFTMTARTTGAPTFPGRCPGKPTRTRATPSNAPKQKETPMPTWTVAGVQMNCALGDRASNRAAIVAKLHQAADRGAKLVVFPECVLTGYGFDSREHARSAAEPLPGPSTDFVAAACAKLGVW